MDPELLGPLVGRLTSMNPELLGPLVGRLITMNPELLGPQQILKNYHIRPNLRERISHLIFSTAIN